MSIKIPVLLALGIACGGPIVPAGEAQTPAFFVEGSVHADYDSTLRSQTGTTVGGSAAAGVRVSPGLSFRIEIDVPRWHGSYFAGSGQVGDRIERFEQQEDRRMRSISVLAGAHVHRRERLDVALLGGYTAARPASRSDGRLDILTLDGTLIDSRTHRRADGGYLQHAVTVGVDAEVRMTRRLSIVPQVRASGFVLFAMRQGPNVWVRPRVAIRWRF